jgi:hypothetical protein
MMRDSIMTRNRTGRKKEVKLKKIIDLLIKNKNSAFRRDQDDYI